MTMTAVASHWCLREWVPLESCRYATTVKYL